MGIHTGHAGGCAGTQVCCDRTWVRRSVSALQLRPFHVSEAASSQVWEPSRHTLTCEHLIGLPKTPPEWTMWLILNRLEAKSLTRTFH